MTSFTSHLTVMLTLALHCCVQVTNARQCDDEHPCIPGYSCNPIDGVCYLEPPAVGRPYAWLGEPPQCNRTPSDCDFFDFEFDLKHKRGELDGEWCETGEKVRCLSMVVEPLPDPSPINTFTVLSYNIFERNFYITHDGQRERTCRIPRALFNLEGLRDIDAIIWQEAFMGGCWPTNATLRDLLNQHGFSYSTNTIEADDRPENGGIFISSRWPVTEEDAHVYETFHEEEWDQMSAKGAKYAKIQKSVSGLQRFYHVFGTHLQAGGGANGDVIRLNQSVEWAKFVQRKAIPKTEAVIYGGDFNTALYKEPNQLKRILSSLKAAVPSLVGEQNATADPRINDVLNDSSHTGSPSWIDYVIYSTSHLVPQTSTMQALVPTSTRAYPVCWCEQCVPLEGYRYPDDPTCERVRTIKHLSDHLPVVGSFKYQ